jgi:cytochrome c oxidase subunit 2
MTALIVVFCIILIGIVIFQIGKVTELAGRIRGEEESQYESNRVNGILSMVFMVVFLGACIVSAYYYKNYFLGYGPHEAASAHGGALDGMFNTTLIFTGIVFVLTQILLFYFAWIYRGRRGSKATFMPHDNKLEIIWTAVPAVVMTFLVIGGLDAWNEVMADVSPDEEFIEFEATGYQFGWMIRYPGDDGKLGTKDYRQITGLNPLGQDWTDTKNLDDFHASEIVLPVNKKVRVRITSRDVLHNFYLPHFRVKMDAVPGMPTYFVFTPTKTTEEYRQQLRGYDEYNVPVDPADPESPMLWEDFKYELACAELCGKGHYSMRREVRIVSEAEYEQWVAQQQSWYLSNIRNSDEDPFKGDLLDVEIEKRAEEFGKVIEEARAADEDARLIKLENVSFETGSSTLTSLSRYELDNVLAALNKYETMMISLEGHTDNTGEYDRNLELSRDRAKAVYDYLVTNGADVARLSYKGYGDTQPLESNDTEEGRKKNRRTELRITSL